MRICRTLSGSGEACEPWFTCSMPRAVPSVMTSPTCARLARASATLACLHVLSKRSAGIPIHA
jgi:hypothetical protein